MLWRTLSHHRWNTAPWRFQPSGETLFSAILSYSPSYFLVFLIPSYSLSFYILFSLHLHLILSYSSSHFLLFSLILILCRSFVRPITCTKRLSQPSPPNLSKSFQIGERGETLWGIMTRSSGTSTRQESTRDISVESTEAYYLSRATTLRWWVDQIITLATMTLTCVLLM